MPAHICLAFRCGALARKCAKALSYCIYAVARRSWAGRIVGFVDHDLHPERRTDEEHPLGGCADARMQMTGFYGHRPVHGGEADEPTAAGDAFKRSPASVAW